MTLVGNGRLASRDVTESKDRPRRLVIDLPNVTSTAPAQTAIDSPLVTRVRVAVNSHQPLVTRVVMEIAGSASYRVERSGESGRDLAVVFEQANPANTVLLTPAEASTAPIPPEPAVAPQTAMATVAANDEAGSRGRAGRSDAGVEVGGGGTSNVVESSAGTQQRRDQHRRGRRRRRRHRHRRRGRPRRPPRRLRPALSRNFRPRRRQLQPQRRQRPRRHRFVKRRRRRPAPRPRPRKHQRRHLRGRPRPSRARPAAISLASTRAIR